MDNLEINSNLEDIKFDRNWLFETKRDFSRRWNIDLCDDNFYNRCIEQIGQLIHPSQYIDISDKINLYLGKVDINRKFYLNFKNEYVRLSDSSPKFSNSTIYIVLNNFSNNETFIQFIEILELVINIYPKDYNEEIITIFNNIASISNKPIRLVYDNGYKFYPSGVEIFDKKLIDDILEFLKDYPQSHKEFTEALTIFIKENGSYRDTIDKTRLALEIFLKQYLNNDKSLENQQNNLGQYLKSNNIHKEIMNLFNKLLDTYSKLNNEEAKHDSGEFKKCEVEFLFYLVGNFMKFLIEAKSEN